MITTADAIEILTVVAACHRRTAPRLDDRGAAIATAAIWAELFNARNLTLDDLVAAVKKRATDHPDAPEPAEIITYARDIRRDRNARSADRSEYEQLCESKSEDAAELAANRARLAELVSGVGKSVRNA